VGRAGAAPVALLLSSLLIPVAEVLSPLVPAAPRAPVTAISVDKGAVAVAVTAALTGPRPLLTLAPAP